MRVLRRVLVGSLHGLAWLGIGLGYLGDAWTRGCLATAAALEGRR